MRWNTHAEDSYIDLRIINFRRRIAKTTAVSDDVYELLVKSKLANESFSDVIRRSIKRGTRLSDIAASQTVAKEEWVKVAKAFEPQKKLDAEKRPKLLK